MSSSIWIVVRIKSIIVGFGRNVKTSESCVIIGQRAVALISGRGRRTLPRRATSRRYSTASPRPVLLQVAAIRQAQDLAGAGDVASVVGLGGADDVEDVEVDRLRRDGEAARFGEVVAADPAAAGGRSLGAELLALAADAEAAVHDV